MLLVRNCNIFGWLCCRLKHQPRNFLCRFEKRDEIHERGGANNRTQTTPHYHWYQTYYNHAHASHVILLLLLRVSPCRFIHHMLPFWTRERKRVLTRVVLKLITEYQSKRDQFQWSLNSSNFYFYFF